LTILVHLSGDVSVSAGSRNEAEGITFATMIQNTRNTQQYKNMDNTYRQQQLPVYSCFSWLTWMIGEREWISQ